LYCILLITTLVISRLIEDVSWTFIEIEESEEIISSHGCCMSLVIIVIVSLSRCEHVHTSSTLSCMLYGVRTHLSRMYRQRAPYARHGHLGPATQSWGLKKKIRTPLENPSFSNPPPQKKLNTSFFNLGS
jgi:hypothetical protein